MSQCFERFLRISSLCSRFENPGLRQWFHVCVCTRLLYWSPAFWKTRITQKLFLSTCFVCNSRHYEYRRKQALGDRCMISLCVCARVTLKLHIPVKCVNCPKWHVAPCQNRNIINFIAIHGILAERANHTHRGWQDGGNILKKKPLC